MKITSLQLHSQASHLIMSSRYNNEWMIVDYSKFTPGQKPNAGDGLLYVLEQIP